MLTIGKAARDSGLSASAIRYYERRGLLRASRLPNGYRVYDEEAVRLLRFVRRAQSLGITLREIQQLLRLARNGRRPCRQARVLARRHLAGIERRIRELRSLRRQLRGLMSRRVPARSDELCPLIPSARP
jgi:DNA-binding transcriptional MerR regulator